MRVIQAVILCSAIAVLAGVGRQANAAIIGFEDLPNGFVPSSYQGFTWSGGYGTGSWVVNSETSDIFSALEVHSGTKYAWSNGATDLSLSDGAFDFVSVWARIGNQTSGTAIARGFDSGNTEIYTMTLNLTDQYQQFNLNFMGITSWKLTNQATNVLLDDLELNTSAVPEPTSLALFSLAGLGLGTARRRRQAA